VKATVQWVASNLPLMVLALILATLAWIVAMEEGDPTIEERYPQAFPVTLSEPPEGMVVVGEFDERVQVTVRAPESVWRSLKVSDFTVMADLTGLGTGHYTVPVQVALSKSPSRVISVEPEYITLELQPHAELTMPVRVQIEGKPTLGYLVRAPVVTPQQVTVSGPSSYVAQVAEVVTQVSVQDANTDIEGEFPLQPQDSEGRSVPYVELTHDKAVVRIPIELSSYYRPLIVKVSLEGQISPGYRITDISVEPPTVTVFGTPDAIAALPGYIETEPISVEGAQGDVVEKPLLNVPPNLVVVPGQQPVEVRVSIEAIQSSLTMGITPEIQGMGLGLTATVSPETVEVILSGPLPLLEALEADDVHVILNLFRLSVGTYQIEPQVVVPEGVAVQSILPATVQVEVIIAPTSTSTES